MSKFRILKSAALAGVSAFALAAGASAAQFNIPSGDLQNALDAYSVQSGVSLIVSGDVVRGIHTRGAIGELTADAALSRILAGTGLVMHRHPSGAIAVVHDAPPAPAHNVELAGAEPTHAAASVETVVVTSSKIKGDIQTVPIAITALSQEQLTSRQIAGGPDLVKEVPNLTFSKTNFTGYNIQIRGIGTQAISVTTDPAVAVAFNDIPFIRNHFFEQEFYDVSQVEVLRGPQGTLYGRNATAGVVNVISAKPTDQFEAALSADWGNYSNRRYEGMVNIPIVDDRLDLRVAGEWTKRNGYTYDSSLGTQVDGRDLWSTRVTLGWKPVESVQAYAIWEHFDESDDRVRSAKQLCKKDPGPDSVDGLPISSLPYPGSDHRINMPPSFTQDFVRTWLSQGCLPTSLYSPQAFETPNGQVYPFFALGAFFSGYPLLNDVDPYASQTQSRNLRDIQSLIKPHYRAKNDTLEFNADWAVTPSLTLTSQTGYNEDFLYSTEDLNRFNTAPGIFNEGVANDPDYSGADPLQPDGKTYCDPQLGCSQSMVGQDLSQERAWQLSQEFRLASNFKGPLNFSVGANYLHYQTVEDYYVFFNLITAEAQLFNSQDAGQYTECDSGSSYFQPYVISPEPVFLAFNGQQAAWPIGTCKNGIIDGKTPGNYIDPNPLGQINGQGHNYFRSENPYALNSYAGFGEVYYQVAPDLKMTGGLRWTDDQKTFWDIPSWVFEAGGGYPVMGIVRQEWKEWTGRGVIDWTPKLDFTDQTLVYASYSRGYKGGGANPPGPIADIASAQSSVEDPPTFRPEFINAYELGTKNTLLDGGLTLNGDVFYYDYKGYQISQIVNRTSINLNFDATVKGAELEASYEPIPGLKFNFAGGYEDTRVNNGQSAIDLMDRTAGHSDWILVRPYVDETQNCILPAAAVRQIIEKDVLPALLGGGLVTACDAAYGASAFISFFDQNDQTDKDAFAAVGFDPSTAPNNGEGFAKNLGGNQLPNAPHFTTSLSADYTIPVSEDWAATLHSDFYWQSQSFARIFNDRPYDKLRGYSNVNLALILTSADGWQVMGYLKNVFDTTAITGAFLFSDDTALTTNIFVTDPRLFGVRVTKNW
jgi:iron complex outermembrane receptor protein